MGAPLSGVISGGDRGEGWDKVGCGGSRESGGSPAYLICPIGGRLGVGRTADRARKTDAGRELAPAFAGWRTGCCGVIGPVPQPLWIRCAPNCQWNVLTQTPCPESSARLVELSEAGVNRTLACDAKFRTALVSFLRPKSIEPTGANRHPSEWANGAQPAERKGFAIGRSGLVYLYVRKTGDRCRVAMSPVSPGARMISNRQFSRLLSRRFKL